MPHFQKSVKSFAQLLSHLLWNQQVSAGESSPKGRAHLLWISWILALYCFTALLATWVWFRSVLKSVQLSQLSSANYLVHYYWKEDLNSNLFSLLLVRSREHTTQEFCVCSHQLKEVSLQRSRNSLYKKVLIHFLLKTLPW